MPSDLAAGIEGAEGAPAMTFAWGVDDTLSTPGLTLHLVRFEAHGSGPDAARVQWDFGDGTRGAGRTATHVYFKPGEYRVTLRAGAGAPPVTQRIYVWTAPIPTSPHSLGRAVELLSADDWSHWNEQRFNSAFDFLLVSEQPNRWPLVEKLARQLLAQPDLDVKRRVALQTTLLEAHARQGRGAETLKLLEEALKTAGKVASLKVAVMLKGADVQWNYLREFPKAAQLYEGIVQDHRNLSLPAVREAAIHWGDLLTQSGDLVQAAERYRLAKSLGGERFAATGQSEAIQRGALLRITEQKLRSGDVRGTRLLLERLELEFPEQKLEGLYRFLRAETDRFAGRYEDAIRHYEVLLKLRQWAGFRDRAGVAGKTAGRVPGLFRAAEIDAGLQRGESAGGTRSVTNCGDELDERGERSDGGKFAGNKCPGQCRGCGRGRGGRDVSRRRHGLRAGRTAARRARGQARVRADAWHRRADGGGGRVHPRGGVARSPTRQHLLGRVLVSQARQHQPGAVSILLRECVDVCRGRWSRGESDGTRDRRARPGLLRSVAQGGNAHQDPTGHGWIAQAATHQLHRRGANRRPENPACE